MKRFLTSAIALLILTAPLAARLRNSSPPPPAIVKIIGSVKRGDNFEKDIWTGGVFRLRQEDLGWIIQVGPKEDPMTDYSAVVTPPFHGVNDLFIEGWHFRNKDNTGANAGDVNAPQKEREFRYVPGPKEFADAEHALNEYMYTYKADDKQRDQDLAKLSDIIENKTYKGKLTIEKLELGNLVQGQQAWIESMDFTAVLEIPRKK